MDFWTLGNAIAGRGRRYHRIVIDEAAFTKDGDNTLDDSMMGLWEKAIKPTPLDFNGEALVCSNSNGKDPDNFFYTIGTDPKYGFAESPSGDMAGSTLALMFLASQYVGMTTRRMRCRTGSPRTNTCAAPVIS